MRTVVYQVIIKVFYTLYNTPVCTRLQVHSHMHENENQPTPAKCCWETFF